MVKGSWLACICIGAVALSGCEALLDEDADSYVSADFLEGRWNVWSMRFVDGLTLYEGENGFAGQPDKLWTLEGAARFTEDQADVRFFVTLADGTNPPDTTAFVYVGTFEVDRNTIWITDEESGEVIRLNIRRDHAAILVGERMLDNFSLLDADGNESLWVRR